MYCMENNSLSFIILQGLLSPTHFSPKGEKMKIPQQGNIKMKEHKSTAYIVDA